MTDAEFRRFMTILAWVHVAITVVNLLRGRIVEATVGVLIVAVVWWLRGLLGRLEEWL